MNKMLKRIVSVICSLAMIVSSITFCPKTKVGAADVDFKSLAYTTVTQPMDSTYGYYIVRNTITGVSNDLFFYNTNYMQITGNGNSKLSNQTITVTDDSGANYTDTLEYAARTEAVYQIMISKLPDNKYYLIKLEGDTGVIEIALKKGNPSGSSETTTDQTSEINLALGKQATTGYKNFQYSLNNVSVLTDGVIGTGDEKIYPSPQTYGWYQIDLGAYYTIESLDRINAVYGEGNDGEPNTETYPTKSGGYYIQYSIDGSTFVQAVHKVPGTTYLKDSSKYNNFPYHSDDVSQLTSADLNGMKAVRYVRVFYPDAYTYGVQLRELEIINTNNDATTVDNPGGVVPEVPSGLAYDRSTGKVTWNVVSDADSYELYINGSTTAISVDTNEYAYELTKSGTYTFAVAAKNETGSSAKSDVVSIGYTKPVSAVTAIGGVKQIKVNWTDDTTEAGNTKYYIYLDGYAEGKEPVATHIGKNTESVVVEATPGNHTVSVVSEYNGTKSTEVISKSIYVYPMPIALTDSDIEMVDDYTTANVLSINIKTESMLNDATYEAILYDENGQELKDSDGRFLYKSAADSTGNIVIKNVPEGTYVVKIRTIVNDEYKEYTYKESINIKELVFPSKLTVQTADNSISVGWTLGNQEIYSTCQFIINVYNEAGTIVKTVTTDSGATNAEVKGLVGGNYKVSALAKKGDYTSREIFYAKDQTFIYKIQDASEVTVLDEIKAPTSVVATADGVSKMKFTFTPVANAKSYKYVLYNEKNEKVTSFEEITTNATDDNNNIYYVLGKLIPGKYYVAVLSVRSDGKESAYNKSEMVEIEGPNVAKVGTITKTVKATTITSQDVTISWGVKGNIIEGQYFNIYIDGVKVNESKVTKTSFDYSFKSSGYHDITVKAVYGEKGDLEYTETEGSSTYINIALDDGTAKLQGSDDLKVEGFQIKTANLSNDGKSIAYRTVCKAPNVGSEVVGADGKTYIVKNFGLSYMLDENMTGNKRYDVCDSSYNTLDVDGGIKTDKNGIQYLDGLKSYLAHKGEASATIKARGYIATKNSIISDWNIKDTTHTYYVLTMDDFAVYMANSIHVRPFIQVVEKNDSSETVKYIYANNVATTSVAQIADYIYRNSISKNYAAHQYLFTNILSSDKLKADYICKDDNNIYFRTVSLNYGWNSNLYVPKVWDVVDVGTLDDLNAAN